METFPFSEKRFASLPPARRHKWIAIWLQNNYEELLNRRFNDKNLERFFDKYLSVRSWLDEPNASIRKPRSYRKWLEFVSEHFHEHRRKSGKGLAEANFLPRIITGDLQPEGPWNPRIPYRVAIDHMRSAFNVGSIIRVVDAAGFESVMLSSGTPGKETGQVRKTAMGCAEWIPQKKHKDLRGALIRAKDEAYTVIGIETIADSFGYAEYPWPEKGIVVVGNEEYGITEDVMKACDDFVHLPMSGFKNSVNVANAFAVIAFHISTIKNL
ncbi:MAG: hypothetical protein JXR49_12175 [Acidobacteria bacterium]|nr:hypothetical protein [Acidobacteriota bacterium]